MIRAARAAALLVAIAVAAIGCAAGPMPAPTPSDASTLPEGVTVQLIQQRSDVADRVVQVRVRNGSDATFAFTGFVFDDDRFEGPVARDDASSLEPGRIVELPIALPPVACDDDATGARRLVTFALTDGGEAVADLAGDDDFSAGLHARDCLRAEVERTAALEWTDFAPSPPGEPAIATLTVRPTGAGDHVELGAVQSTVLVEFPDPADRFALDLTIDRDSTPLEVGVALVPQRCDPHVVAEDKRGTVFTLEVVRPTAGTFELPMSSELKGRVLTWVADWCGFNG